MIAILCLMATPALSQEKITRVGLPFKNGKLCFEKHFDKNRQVSKRQVAAAVQNCLNKTFSKAGGLIQSNIIASQSGKTSELLQGDARIKIFTGHTTDYYWLKFKYSLILNDSAYVFKVSTIYEKPFEQGITNEYSKLEYRYWDYSNGKPWTKDDQPLFMGLQAKMTSLETSLEQAVNSIIIEKPAFKILALYSKTVEGDHVDFGIDAIRFFSALAEKRNFSFDTTSNWNKLNEQDLNKYQLIIWLNDFPQSVTERSSFEKYIEQGGAWLGFHVAAYNDKDTHWPWFVNFLGGAVFFDNNWPPLQAKMIVDDIHHPVTRRMPSRFTAPINEWYGWKPNPRLNKDVRVLVTLDPANFPLGKKDIIKHEDIPVVWTNTKYKMLYMNMGHGDLNFSSTQQNNMYEDAIMWLGTMKARTSASN